MPGTERRLIIDLSSTPDSPQAQRESRRILYQSLLRLDSSYREEGIPSPFIVFDQGSGVELNSILVINNGSNFAITKDGSVGSLRLINGTCFELFRAVDVDSPEAKELREAFNGTIKAVLNHSNGVAGLKK